MFTNFPFLLLLLGVYANNYWPLPFVLLRFILHCLAPLRPLAGKGLRLGFKEIHAFAIAG